MYPRVTEILKAVGLARAYPDTPAMERYRQMGTALHLAIQYHAAGTLDEGSLHPELRAGFEAYLTFQAKYDYQPYHTELELVSDRLGVMGHLDAVGLIKGECAIVDWKRSKEPDVATATLQLAAYDLLWSESQMGEPAVRRYVVGLGTGMPRVVDVTDQNAREVFKAALIVYRARAERGLL